QRPTQFFQAGVELLGLEDRAAGEREILSLVIEALRAAGLKEFSLRIGDVALFGALVDSLSLPKQWRWRLKRHFWRAGYVENLIQWLAQGGSHKAPTRAELEAMLDSEAEAAALHLDPKVSAAIIKLLDISAPADRAMVEIRALLKTAGIQLDAQ